MTRKYFYLTTEHEQGDRIGEISVIDSRASQPTKNAEAPIRVFDKEQKDFVTVGKHVGLGYHDFESEDEYERRAVDVMRTKIRDVDREWAEKAGIEDEIYDSSRADDD
jgi:hypothetical protein